MTVLFDAVAMANAPSLDQQAVAHLGIPLILAVAQRRTATLDQSQVGQQPGTIVLVAEIGPDDVVEDVCLEGVDGAGEASELFRPCPRQASGVDDEARYVV